MTLLIIYLSIGCLFNLFLVWQKALHHWLIVMYFLFLWPVVLGKGLGTLIKERAAKKRQ